MHGIQDRCSSFRFLSSQSTDFFLEHCRTGFAKDHIGGIIVAFPVSALSLMLQRSYFVRCLLTSPDANFIQLVNIKTHYRTYAVI